MLPDNGVFTCSSNSLQTGFCAFLTDCSGNVFQQANMTSRRFAHGLIGYTESGLNDVNAFGGGDTCAGKTCESFGLGTRIWEMLPDMQFARSRFNPCAFTGEIYLCGGTPSYSIEVFSPQFMRFTTLPISLPPTLDECYSVASDREIIVVGKKKAAKLMIESDEKLIIQEISSKNYSKKPAIANPVRRGDEVVVVTSGLVGKFHMGRCRFETIKSFP